MHEPMAGYVERGEVPGIVTLVSRRGHVTVQILERRWLPSWWHSVPGPHRILRRSVAIFGPRLTRRSMT